jgi:hypothetical protein
MVARKTTKLVFAVSAGVALLVFTLGDRVLSWQANHYPSFCNIPNDGIDSNIPAQCETNWPWLVISLKLTFYVALLLTIFTGLTLVVLWLRRRRS